MSDTQTMKLGRPLRVQLLKVFFVIAFFAMTGCATLPTHPVCHFPTRTRKTTELPVAAEWKTIPVGMLRHSMGNSLRPLPRVEFRIAYDADALYLCYTVMEYAVRAVARHHGDMVCGDSCVEFFFSPSEDLSEGYFNLEINCGGTALLHYRSADDTRIHKTTAWEFQEAEISTSLPRIVEPERPGPLAWTLNARIPYHVLQRIHYFPKPCPGTIWRGNFFKCGDLTSRPHWLTWAKVSRAEPAFHVPKDFGKLIFR